MSMLNIDLSRVFDINLSQEKIQHYLPVINRSPALNEADFSLDYSLVTARAVSALALGTLSLVALFWLGLAAPTFTAGIIGICAFGAGNALLEIKRAKNVLDALPESAVNEYCNNTYVPQKAAEYICSSPKAFQMLLDRKESLQKKIVFPIGSCLFFELLFGMERKPEGQKVQQMYIDHCEDPTLPCGERGNSVFTLAEYASPFSLNYLFESKKLPVPQDPKEQMVFWKQVTKTSSVKILCLHGFKIDAEEDEKTPSMHWAEEYPLNNSSDQGFALILSAFETGADLQRTKDLIRAKNRFLAALLEDAEKTLPIKPDSLPKDETPLRWLPRKACVYKDNYSYKGDHSTTKKVELAVIGSGLIFLGLFALTILIHLVDPIPMFFTAVINFGGLLTAAMITSIFINHLYTQRNYEEANRQAVIEYLTAVVPSDQAMRTICYNKEAAQMLIQSVPKGSPLLNKYSHSGSTLLSNKEISFETFQLLIDHGADLFKPSLYSLLEHQGNGFAQAAYNNDPEFVDYLFKSGRLSVNTMSEEQKMFLWTSVHSKRAAQVLITHGLSPNEVKDGKGNTPLMNIVLKDSLVSQQARILLKIGADPSIPNLYGKTVKELM